MPGATFVLKYEGTYLNEKGQEFPTKRVLQVLIPGKDKTSTLTISAVKALLSLVENNDEMRTFIGV